MVRYSFGFGTLLRYTPTGGTVFLQIRCVSSVHTHECVPVHFSSQKNSNEVRYSFEFDTSLRCTPTGGTIFLWVRYTSSVHTQYSIPSSSVHLSCVQPWVVQQSFGFGVLLRYTSTGGTTFLRARYTSSVHPHRWYDIPSGSVHLLGIHPRDHL